MITTNDNIETRESIPNQAFDSEYMTEWNREVKYLASKGINYTFVKKTKDYGIRQYKYKKTPELFLALAEFYYQTLQEKQFEKFSKMLNDGIQIPKDLEEQFAKIVMKDSDSVG